MKIIRDQPPLAVVLARCVRPASPASAVAEVRREAVNLAPRESTRTRHGLGTASRAAGVRQATGAAGAEEARRAAVMQLLHKARVLGQGILNMTRLSHGHYRAHLEVVRSARMQRGCFCDKEHVHRKVVVLT